MICKICGRKYIGSWFSHYNRFHKDYKIVSERLKGRKLSEETREKLSKAHKGKTGWAKGLTKETDERVKRVAEKLKGRPKSAEHKKKLSLLRKGKSYSEIYNTRAQEIKDEISRTLKAKTCGCLNPFYGKQHTEEFKLKQKLRNVGHNNPNWKGGRIAVNKGNYGPEWSYVRVLCLKRDNFECQICSSKKNVAVHHLIPFRVFGKQYHIQANRLENLLTVCRICHNKIEPKPWVVERTKELYDPSLIEKERYIEIWEKYQD